MKDTLFDQEPDHVQETIVVGDRITISGLYRNVPNPDRRWWQFWKPRMIAGGPQTFAVVGAETGKMFIGPD